MGVTCGALLLAILSLKSSDRKETDDA
jgi:hypothetical protein